MTTASSSNLSQSLIRLKSEDVRFARPCRKQGTVLQRFGTYKVDGVLLPHTGIEFAVPPNTRLTSCSHGVVRYVGFLPGLGTIVIIGHGGGYDTVMGPFSEQSIEVASGSSVVQGQTLGRVLQGPKGKTPFVHLELRKDAVAIDPASLLQ